MTLDEFVRDALATAVDLGIKPVIGFEMRFGTFTNADLGLMEAVLVQQGEYDRVRGEYVHHRHPFTSVEQLRLRHEARMKDLAALNAPRATFAL